MYYLTSENDERVIYVTPKYDTVTIGRSPDQEVCDFNVRDDSSISRRHATLLLSGSDLTVMDLGSKYGTFINQAEDEKVNIEKDVMKTLKKDDNVRFGIMSCVWKVHKKEFITCTSTLKGESLNALRKCLGVLGGTFKTEWDDTCNFLTMPAITLTIKVVLALVQGAHIVNVSYWYKCAEAIVERVKLPDPKDYVPDIVESTLNKEEVSFLPNLNRQKIFAGKRIVFLSKRQMEMYKNILLMSGGNPVLLSETKVTKSMLSAPDAIVVQYVINNTTQESQALKNQLNSIVEYLKSKGKRVVADPEIGLAILFCSLDRYCNPDFSVSLEVMKENMKPQAQQKPNILAVESQEPTKSKNENVVIDESLMETNSDADLTFNSKRKISEENETLVNSVSKKFASEDRVLHNDDDDFFNFIKQEPETNNDSKKSDTPKLNLAKPLKRRAEQISSNNEEDLFNFISPEEKTDESSEPTPKIFKGQSLEPNIQIKDEPKDVSQEEQEKKLKECYNESFKSFSKFKGISLEDLLKQTLCWKSTDDIDVSVKKEESVKYEEDDGSIIVITNDSLIKDRKVDIPNNSAEENNQTKNFKKFKKVWPTNMQKALEQRSLLSCNDKVVFNTGPTAIETN